MFWRRACLFAALMRALGLECMYDDGMGFPNLQRELTRARNTYLGAVRRLDAAMRAFSVADVPLMPAENGAIAPWTADHGAAMSACVEAWSAVVAARRGVDAAERDLAANDP